MTVARFLEGIEFGTTLRIESWADPIVDALGHDPRSEYVETFWLPVLGPSTTWLLRHLATRLDSSPRQCLIDVAETARALGLGERSGKHAPFLRTVTRAIDFSMARPAGGGVLAVRRRLPPLARRNVLRLSPSLQARHAAVDAESGGVLSPGDALRRRGEQLALSLLELGESPTDTQRQLLRWHFPPALAHQCLTWATQAHEASPLESTDDLARVTRLADNGPL